MQASYFFTLLIVAFDFSVKTATRITTLYMFTSFVVGPVCGLLVYRIRRLKYFIVSGTVLFLVGFGLLIRYRGGAGTSSCAGLIAAQVILGVAGGLTPYASLTSLQVSLKQEAFVVMIGLFLACHSIGDALGNSVAGAIWTQILPTFWHQLFRWPMQGISSFVCRDILHLPRPSLIERYANIVVVFVISATLHLAIDSRAGIMHPQTGALRCFLIQPLGIMLEDGAQAIYRRVHGGAATYNKWTKLAGYIWAWAFLTLVAPLYNVPLFRYEDPNRNGVPLPIIQTSVDYLGSRE
ncbi:hypothetical protein N7499_002836 [Penicillium canescens]|uniref:Wax synthase domain-containing protein n=1 Tax=Penicillium canescens TaxID=5083 RepID=A0AAD6N728_PENCN|nr:uncharacterized protein N7446_010471 [Penicillium canescens]KAJ6035709.1 hypothetical protein N7460_009884 [Penicillium canescens]KAJ6037833.1 hypothetical protein N7444_010538 [Penicillium canescens]KAJ6054459.1 hypothetical protein N7446_010471 [Penicillium canescens]KAJ6098462.1 hypothetical protein N7499_002836 [Penicillium canescens]KAJ6166451.1 hypothetical protein N7485_009695 [Penicillium canescens]